MKKINLDENTIAAYTICPRKSFYYLFSAKHDETDYLKFLNSRRQDTEEKFFSAANSYLTYKSDRLSGKAEYIRNANFQHKNLAVRRTHLFRCHGKSKLGNYFYEPLIFSLSSKITVGERIKSLHIAKILDGIQGTKLKISHVVLIDGSKKTIRLNSKEYIPILNELNNWIDNKPEIPPITFNKSCPNCPFIKQCEISAEKDDSIGLLNNMPQTLVKKYHSKGIFTINQMSYLYRPRRRSRHWGERKPKHQYELQALALRTQKIYTDNLLDLQKSEIEIYIDIESVPDQKFHYLIGVLVSSNSGNKHHAFWAKNIINEKCTFALFLRTVNRYPSAPIYHYGNYDKKVILELARRYGTQVDDTLSRFCNINEYIYGRIYFPTLTNRLKDICKYLGFAWSSEEANGLNSIIWRYDYDKTQSFIIRKKLLTYNQEDCLNLKRLKDSIYAICSCDSTMPDVMAADNNNQLLTTAGSQSINDLTNIIKSAHGKYEQSKISFRKKQKKKAAQSITGRVRRLEKSKIDKEVRVARGRVCPRHKRKLSTTNIIQELIIIDLISTPRGIKKLTTRYWGYKGRCPNCSHRHSPPGFKRFGKNAKYGYGLKAWITYQRMAMRLPFRKISQLLEDSFDIVIASSGIETLHRSVNLAYEKTEINIIKAMLASPKIHVDETLVNIQGKIQYVWVFTDGEHVVFRLTPTRDSTIVHQILKNYEGVLITDFFAGYEAVKCCQQKCWVHLIRDINEDLRKSPFDSEFDNFVSLLRDMLLPIFEAVEKYGLKKRNLNKFRKSVDRFYKKNIFCVTYDSDVTKKYQKRLSRHKDNLFVFLERDGIPWNNNMAERALRHLAVQRKISGSFFASAMEGYLRMLGLMQTCRFQNKPFLEFLMSGEKDIDQFKGKKHVRGWTMR